MKILFTADWHIKLGAKGVPVEWAANKFRLLFQKIYEMEQQCDMHIIGGDIFDKLPNMQELELYFEFISGCKKPTIIYPGNHEALKKDTSFLTNLKGVTNNLNPLVTICDTPRSDLLGGLIDILPYAYIKTFNPDDYSGDILFTHVRGEIPPHVKPEVPLEKFSRWKLVLAGDLHSYENSQKNILYPGSPTTTSFHRNLVDTGCIVLDTTTLTHEFIKFDLPQLIRKTVKVGDPTPATDFHHTVYEVEGDIHELAALEDNELVDKKVSKKSSDVTLLLDPKLSMAEEVKEYLQFILGLPDSTINEVLQEYRVYEPQFKD